MKVRVDEYFYSWQGEGRNAGRVALFFRFPGCNLKCPWCDTKYAWNLNNTVEVDVVSLKIPKLVVITGGEPLADWNRECVESLLSCLYGVEQIEIETNGTFPPLGVKDGRVSYVVSPKPLYVEGDRKGIIHLQWLCRDDIDVIWKFVIGDERDEDFVERFLNAYKIDREKVYLMPRGNSTSQLLTSAQRVVGVAKKYSVNISPRLHVLFGFAKQERQWRDEYEGEMVGLY